MSQDSTARRSVDAQFDPGGEQRDELRSLERLIGLLAEEMRTRFDLLDAKLTPFLERDKDDKDDFNVRLNRHEKELHDHADQLTALRQSAKQRLKTRK